METAILLLIAISLVLQAWSILTHWSKNPLVKKLSHTELNEYLEREARISTMQMKIMDLKIEAEVERQLNERANAKT